MNRLDTINLLNRLIITTKNGQNSLRAAAEEAHHTALKEALYGDAAFFGAAAEELQDAVRKLGGEPRELGSFDNTLHRTWMHLKLTALGRDESVLLDTIEPDEAEVEARYAEAVDEDMPEEVHAVLVRQYLATRNRRADMRRRQQLAHPH